MVKEGVKLSVASAQWNLNKLFVGKFAVSKCRYILQVYLKRTLYVWES